jgi:hypothetical protein
MLWASVSSTDIESPIKSTLAGAQETSEEITQVIG